MIAKSIFAFLIDVTRAAFKGGRFYYVWMGVLSLLVLAGGFAYLQQFRHGLSVTGMTDQVSWGLYISNFTFLVGVAAAAVMLVLPTYILDDPDLRDAVLIGEGIAVGALIMCLCFVTADMGGPLRLWHLTPILGRFNWPVSLLTWDIIVLNGYLALNGLIPAYLLWCKYTARKPHPVYKVFTILSVFWAVSIHLVTAFLYASQPARPFWHNALLGPRFLASAFCAGPALIMVVLWFIRTHSAYKVTDNSFRKLSLIVTGAAQINLIMLFSELFTEFYHPTEHTASAYYLLFGLHGHNQLVPIIWPALIANVTCTLILTINPLRRNLKVTLPVCVILFFAIFTEKGMGLIVPGFIPSPLGEIKEYTPSWVEILVSVSIWALGILVVTVMVRLALAIELGTISFAKRSRFSPKPLYQPRPPRKVEIVSRKIPSRRPVAAPQVIEDPRRRAASRAGK